MSFHRQLLVALLLAGCVTSPPRPQPAPQLVAKPPPSIQGVVSGAKGPVAGAIVAANRYDQFIPRPIVTRTDSAGLFSFELEPDTYALTATAPGETAAYVPDLVVTKGGHLTPLVQLGGESVRLQGRVSVKKGALPRTIAIQAVRISQVDGDVFVFDATADASFELLLPKATYVLSAEAGELTSAMTPSEPGEQVELKLLKQATGGQPTAAALATLRRHLFPLTAVEAGHGSSDLEKLDPLFEGARIVELGEATHGTREFFQLKHRLLEYLVEKHGFRIFAIEATQPEAFDLNDYVLTGKGDPNKALAGLYFWTWDTEEVLTMIEWMRGWNAVPSHTPKLKFYGVDMQYSERAAHLVVEALQTSRPRLLPRFAAVLATLADPLVGHTAEEWLAIQRSLTELAAELDAHPANQKMAFSPGARQSLKVLEQHAALNLEPFGDVRDRSMASNALWALEQEGPDSKMVLWAHNGHVTYDGPTMGAALKRVLGGKVRAFGFGFGGGVFQAKDFGSTGGGLRDFNAPPAPPDTFDGACLALQQPLFVLDLNGLYADKEMAPFEGQVKLRRYGSAASDESLTLFNPEVLEGSYDAWIFVAQTTAARAKPSGRRPTSPPAAPSNLSFEEGLEGWSGSPPEAFDYAIEASSSQPKDGKQALVIRRPQGKHHGPGAVAELSQRIVALPFAGKRVRLEAFVRVSDTMRVSVELVPESTAKQPPGNVTVVGGKEYGNWKKVTVELDVPEGLKTFRLSLRAAGEGMASIDGLALTERPTQ